tara:strand:- start:50 stop:1045 length:996 start_codon:yes stop_codon:yes gene_type:complete
MAQHRAGQAIIGHAMPNSRGTNASGQNRCGMWGRTRIITHGFVGGGYKDSSPWRNVNRTQHSNDSTTDLGDKMGWNGSYIDGGHSDTHFYTFGLDNGYAGTNNDAWRMQMSNESGTNMQDTMGSDKEDLGVFMDYHHEGANIYTMGGSNSTVDRFNMNSHSRSGAAGCPSGGHYTASAQGRLRGWTSVDSSRYYYQFSNDTWYGWPGTQPGTNGWGKANSSYMGMTYFKNQGNCGTAICKQDDFTGAQINIWNVENSGEENYQMGNFKGYCLGQYNGAQNNNSYKMSYTSDTWSQGNNTMEPKGHAGMSSAGCGSASNFVNTTYGVTPPSY